MCVYWAGDIKAPSRSRVSKHIYTSLGKESQAVL